jgi:hypothetical protein
MQLSRGEGWDPNNLFPRHKFVPVQRQDLDFQRHMSLPHINSQNTEKGATTYDVENPGPVFEQAQTCGGETDYWDPNPPHGITASQTAIQK